MNSYEATLGVLSFAFQKDNDDFYSLFGEKFSPFQIFSDNNSAHNASDITRSVVKHLLKLLLMHLQAAL